MDMVECNYMPDTSSCYQTRIWTPWTEGAAPEKVVHDTNTLNATIHSKIASYWIPHIRNYFILAINCWGDAVRRRKISTQFENARFLTSLPLNRYFLYQGYTSGNWLSYVPMAFASIVADVFIIRFLLQRGVLDCIDSCVALNSKIIEEFKPDIVVGSLRLFSPI
jgi:hypothetical protein